MKQFSFFSIVTVLTLLVFCLQLGSCKKDTTTTSTTTCDVRGAYSGSSTPSVGSASPIVYNLKDNNLAVGSVTLGGSPTTFGGYRNTCDSVFISVYYAGNSSYYLLQGKINGPTISGSFKNLTTPSDFGTFTMSK